MAFKMKGSAFKLGNVATKSALKQGTKFTDKLKAFGTAITSRYGLMTPENASLKKAYSKYKSEKKKYRDADRKSEMNK